MKLSLPVMAGQLLETFYNLIDSWFLGKAGPAQLSAPAVCFNLMFLFISLGTGFGAGGTTVISQMFGAGKKDRVRHFTGQLFSLLFLLSCLVFLFSFLFQNHFLIWLKTPSEIMPYASDYLGIVIWGIVPMFLFFHAQSVLQGVGLTFLALIIQSCGLALNIVLDYLLINGAFFIPAFGVKGAAIATVISRTAAAMAGLYVLLFVRNTEKFIPHLHLSELKPVSASWKLLFKIGFPTAVGQMTASLGFSVMQGLVNLYGTSVVAAFSVVNRLNSLFYMPVMGLSRGTAVLVGQCLGAGEKDKAFHFMKTALVSAFFFILPFMVLAFFHGSEYIRFFIQDVQVIEKGHEIFRIVAPSVVIFALYMVMTGVLQGAGDTTPVMLLNLSRLWVFRLPLGYFLAINLNWADAGIWWAMFFSNLAVTLAGFLILKKGHWLNKKLG